MVDTSKLSSASLEGTPKIENSVDENNHEGLFLAIEQGEERTVVFSIDELGMDPTSK